MVEKTKENTIRNGVCSTYLCNSPVGSKVLVSIRSSSFRLPTDPLVPVICVGPGTGFAPFAAFLDDRKVTLDKTHKIGPTFCYTGAKIYNDCIYNDRVIEWSKMSGVNIAIAISREGDKQRVTDIMRLHAEQLVDAIIDKEGYLYICGDARMADDTSAVLLELISKVKGISKLVAKDTLTMVKDSNRMQMDVWGLTSFFNEGATYFAEKKANSAKNWLKMMQS